MGTIFGTVTNEAGDQVLEFATIAIYNSRDSSLVGGGISDIDGKFSLQTKPGKYFLKINFIGQEESIVSDLSIGRGSLQADVGKVAVGPSNLQLDELTVQADRTQMELHLDKKVYNIGKDLSNLGGNAADLLANLPSVDVDVEGNVSLRGSENVRILIDGRPSGLIGLSGSGGLEQLQGSLIDRVEIITNPSARYDAEGGAGIINIILKKERASGFNGSFQLTAGYPASRGVSANLNYRTGWVNWFVNYGVSFRRSPGQGFNNQFFDRADTTYYTDQLSDRNRERISHNVRFGSDFFLNDKNVITLSASYRVSNSENTTEVSYHDFDIDRNELGLTTRIDEEDGDRKNWQYSLNYTRDFKRRGQKLTFDLQYQDNGQVENSMYDENRFPVNGPAVEIIQRSNNDNGEKRTRVEASYIHPFNQFGKLETGFRYTARTIFNDYQVEEQLPSSTFEQLDSLSNDFNFDENIFASYLILSNKADKFSWQVGTRLEQTDLVTLLEQTNERNPQNYFNFFPSAHFTYSFTEQTSMQVSYSRRISRPRYRSLNPFFSYSDPRNIYSGNPNLQPQYTNSYELGILNNKEKSTVYYGIYHRHTDGAVSRIQTEENGITHRRPENLAVRNDIGIEVNVSKDFTNAFRTSGNFNLYNSRTNGLGLSSETNTFSIRWGNNYKNDKFVDAQLNVWYRAPQNTPQGKRFGMASVDVGLSKDVMEKNGTLSVSVRDLFNTRKYKGETITETFTSFSEFQWRKGPTVNLSFTYRINQKKKRQRSGGNRDEGDGEFEGEF